MKEVIRNTVMALSIPKTKTNIPNVIFQQDSEKKLVVTHKMGMIGMGEWKLDSNQGNLDRLWKNPLWVRVFPCHWAVGEAELLGLFSAEALPPSLIPWSVLCTSNNKYKLLRRVATKEHGAP